MAKFISRCKDEFVSPDDIEQYIGKREKETLDEGYKENAEEDMAIANDFEAAENELDKNCDK